MEAQDAWKLFSQTGLPEMYNLYCLLRRETDRRQDVLPTLAEQRIERL